MAFIIKTCYAIACDNCHKQLDHENGLFENLAKANMTAFRNKWTIKKNKHYCPKCSNKLFK